MPYLSLSDSDREHLLRLQEARHHDPFAWLGRHPLDGGVIVRVYMPQVESVELLGENGAMTMSRAEGTDLFLWHGPADELPQPYLLRWRDNQGEFHEGHDPYCLRPWVGDLDLHLFGEGRHWHAYRFLGAHTRSVDGVAGVAFATWAPNADRVSVVGDFNQWDGRRHPMRVRGGSGVWELFVPGLGAGDRYKFEIRNRDSGGLELKTDPYGRWFELRPATASRVEPVVEHTWGDQDWLQSRRHNDWLRQPMSIYEVHLGSWQTDENGGFLGYRDLAQRLVAHVKDLGFTHIELLPVAEHPLDASWGYQVTGYFGPTSRFGRPDDFRYFVDHCHRNGIGVLLDWVPGHFPRDAHGLARYDGSALYEHADPRRGEHRDWGTLIFNYGRNEVRNFLIANAIYWIEEFHIDGLRVDAVASMLYLDYSRAPDDWLPNPYGGRENLEAIAFLRELNTLLHREHPGVVVVAEESTAWPQVSRPVDVGGLGFSMKWNMGWMNDTLAYFENDPVHRSYHHDKLTFGLLYAFTENFVLPFSHDEVVHGKRALLDKMPGDQWQKFANLRLLYAYLFSQPGRKLLFMGAEIGQWTEWDEAQALDWPLLNYPNHQGLQRLLRDLNRLYRERPALHRHDFEGAGFQWLDADRRDESLLFYLRRDGEQVVLVAFNATPVPRLGIQVGVPFAGHWREILNTDSQWYGGGDINNGNGCASDDQPCMGQPHSIHVNLPPLAAVWLALD